PVRARRDDVARSRTTTPAARRGRAPPAPCRPLSRARPTGARSPWTCDLPGDLDHAVVRLPQADSHDAHAAGFERLPDIGGDQLGRGVLQEVVEVLVVVTVHDLGVHTSAEVVEIHDHPVVADRTSDRHLDAVAVAVELAA